MAEGHQKESAISVDVACHLRLIVAAKQALLFPRQDDEAEKITSLAQGEVLVTLLQATGGNDWYMVKTQKGLIGWVKSSDVREQSVKKIALGLRRGLFGFLDTTQLA